MPAHVFVFDRSAFPGATEAVDIAREIVERSPAPVVQRAADFLGTRIDDPAFARTAVLAHVEGSLAASIEAVHDVLQNWAAERSNDGVSGSFSVHSIGPLGLLLVEGDTRLRAKAVLAAQNVWRLRQLGLDLTSAFATLGVQPLPVGDAAMWAAVRGESTLVVATSLLCAIPRSLLVPLGNTDAQCAQICARLGASFYDTLFPGRSTSMGEELLWSDTLVLASRAVMIFEDWRTMIAAHQSVSSDGSSRSRLLNQVVATLARATAAA